MFIDFADLCFTPVDCVDDSPRILVKNADYDQVDVEWDFVFLTSSQVMPELMVEALI